MSVKSIRYPFINHSTINAQYSLELQEHMTREEFKERINEFNKAGIENQINRVILLLPFIFILVIVSVTLPLALLNANFYNSGGKPFTIWIITIVSVVISIILSVSVSYFLFYKSRTKQFFSMVEKLNEFNAIDNLRGINWRIIYDVGQNPHGYNNFYPHYNSHRYLVVEIGQPSENRSRVPQIVIDDSNVNDNTSSNSSIPPPTYDESVKK
ncbi:14026_t:CDS:2 [Funneliformis mosseae]|uniref:14026_t:CDS:1 n=1 Tax=Funneliformis mosseae TaxID=27381 RepID=A0A9N8YKF6_FUNMO|nr:14026_t:CDS:2 [Funneliformis mosseae]